MTCDLIHTLARSTLSSATASEGLIPLAVDVVVRTTDGLRVAVVGEAGVTDVRLAAEVVEAVGEVVLRNVDEVDEVDVLLRVLLVRLIGVLVGREVSGVRVEEALVVVERTEERVVLVLVVDPSALLLAMRDAVLAVAREAVEGVLVTPVTEGVLVARVVEVVVVPEAPLVAGTLEGRGGVAAVVVVLLTPAAASEDTLGFRVVVVEVPSVMISRIQAKKGKERKEWKEERQLHLTGDPIFLALLSIATQQQHIRTL